MTRHPQYPVDSLIFAPGGALWHQGGFRVPPRTRRMAMFDSLFIRLTSRRIGRDSVGNT